MKRIIRSAFMAMLLFASLQSEAQKKRRPATTQVTAQDDWETPAKKNKKTSAKQGRSKIARKPGSKTSGANP